MPVPADFPGLQGPLPKRKPPPDFTSRGTKLRLFSVLAAVMAVLAVWERGCDPRMGQLLQRPPVAEKRDERQAAPAERLPMVQRLAAPDRGEMLDRFGIGAATFSEVVDGQPIAGKEPALLAKTLYLLPRLGRENVERWREAASDWDELAGQPAARRMEVFPIRGRARRAEQIAVPEEQALLYELQHYYRVSLQLGNSEHAADIFTRSIPKAWPLDAPLDEAVEADCFFIKVGESESANGSLLFAAERVRWLPDSLNPDLGVGPSELALAKLGLDVGLWDQVRESNGRPLEAGDREAFYELLAALGQPGASDLKAGDTGRQELGSLLQQPQDRQGESFAVEGVARRIRRIEVPDADVQTRFGIDHYFEIDLFLPLGDAKIRLGEGKGEGPVFHNTFPATLVARELPPGSDADENLHEQIRAVAVFFKIWTYESRYAGKFGQVQPAPLFVAFSPTIVPSGTNSSWVMNAGIGSILCIGLSALALLVWFTRPQKRRQVAEGPPPDFSGLR